MRMREIIGVSSFCGRRMDFEAIDTRNGNLGRCQLCQYYCGKCSGQVARVAEGYS